MDRFLPVFVLIGLLSTTRGAARADDWNQWRGAQRDGYAARSPALIDSLPPTGLKPVWVATDEIPAARDSGWSSPIVAGGHVYLFTHRKQRVASNELGPAKYPYLAPENRGGMSDDQYAEYERNRRDEQEQRSTNFRFDEVVYCLNAATGWLAWTNEQHTAYTRFAQSGSPAVVGGKLYVLGAGRHARCLDARTGKDLWATKLPGDFRDEFLQSSFAVVDGVATVLADSLFGLDAASGELLWQIDPSKQRTLHSSPVEWREGERSWIVANTADEETIGVEPRTGKVLWRVDSLGGHATPIVVGNRLITYGSSRKAGVRCFALSRDSATLVWTNQRVADPGSSPVVVDEHIYVQGERRLACINLETGDTDWMTDLAMTRPRYTSLVAADGKVIYGFEGLLCFADAPDEYRELYSAKIDSDGLLAPESVFRALLNITELEKTAEGHREAERIWRKQIDNGGPLPCSTPAIADGRIYFRLKNGLACYDLRAISDGTRCDFVP